MRAEFVNLFRWRLQNHLDYGTTHALQIVNTAGHPVYTLIFATDSSPGDRIMRHVYDSAATRTIPAMQARARAARLRRREEEYGVQSLFGTDVFPAEEIPPGRGYDHEPPWEPPPLEGDELELTDEVDFDPDDIDPEAWAEGLGSDA
jgi:hypothetical protein